MQEFSVKQSNLDFRTREAYKMLRTNIEFSGDNNKVIFITSSTPSEGKSTVSFELAMSFAQNGMKTLLIDADTRKSVMKNRGKKGKIKYGLTHYLSGKNELKDVICVSDVPNFCMIFAGPVPPNPSELVGNDRFAKMVEEARATFDMIIIDDIIPNFEIDSFTKEIIKDQNGILNYIKKQAKYNITTIIMVTPNNKKIEEQYIKYGFNAYIIKPVNKENIDKVLNKYFKTKE